MKSVRFSLLTLLVALFVTLPLSAQSNSNQIIILETSTQAFPDISFTARVINEQGRAIDGLTGDSFTVGETHDPPLMVTPSTEALHVAIIIDTTINSIDEQNLVREALAQLSRDVLQQGDVINIVPLGGNPITLSNPAELAGVFSSLQFEGSRTPADFRTGFDQAVERLLAYVNSGQNAQAILISSYLPGGDISYTNAAIPLHVLQLHRGRSQSAPRYQSLATGEYVEVTSTGTTLTNFFSNLNSNRRIYEVRYRSRAAGVGMRQVPISVNISGGAAYGMLSYQADVRPPQVEITNAESGDFVIRGNATLAELQNADGSYSYNYDKAAERITARVSFADNIARPIQNARLIINGTEQEDINISLDGQNEFTLTWALLNYVNLDKADIAVSVTDYFNQNAISPGRTFTINYTYPILDEIVVDICMANGQRLNTPECLLKENAGIAFGTMAVLGAAVIGLGGVIIWQRRQIALAANSVRRSFVQISSGVAEVGRKTSIAVSSMFGGGATTIEDQSSGFSSTYNPGFGSNTPMAGGGATAIESSSGRTGVKTQGKTQIEFIEGQPPEILNAAVVPDNAYASFVVTSSPLSIPAIPMSQPRLTLGRDEDHGVDFVIPLQSVSRIHCTILYDFNTKQFLIKDEGSANGTFINDQRLEKGVDRALIPGDVVRLSTKTPFVMQFIPSPRLELTGGGMTDPKPTNRSVRLPLMEGEDEMMRTEPTKSSGIYSGIPAEVATPVNGQHKPHKPHKVEEDDNWID